MDQLTRVARKIVKERKLTVTAAIRLFRKEIAQAALKKAGGNQSEAARLTGMSRTQFQRWVWDLDLQANHVIRSRDGRRCPKMAQ
ncbi:MAG: helix-turn-helix domain-containing protein [Acidobacteria bacterium]|nr:helix-turn-helix domain-containing protein [Acidobacteriota bacterium]